MTLEKGIKEKYSLKKHQTFGLEVTAKYFLEINSIEQLANLNQIGYYKELPLLILGGGSNILFTTDVFDGLVIHINNKGIEIKEESDECVVVKVAAGEIWHDFVLFCVKNRYWGVENLSYIPGRVGSCPVQNIGAYGTEVKDVITAVEGLYIENLEPFLISNHDCNFDYRSSIFKTSLKNKVIITNVYFRLSKVPKININYGSINELLLKKGIVQPSIEEISNCIIEIRKEKLPEPEEFGNAGSFFKNPVVSNDKFEQLKLNFPNIVSYKHNEQCYKIAAGWLIEQCGWKGKNLGNAGVHKNQSLVLINLGNAKGYEIIDLATKIKYDVHKMFDIPIEFEVNII